MKARKTSIFLAFFVEIHYFLCYYSHYDTLQIFIFFNFFKYNYVIYIVYLHNNLGYLYIVQDLRSFLCWRGLKPPQRRAHAGADKKIA